MSMTTNCELKWNHWESYAVRRKFGYGYSSELFFAQILIGGFYHFCKNKSEEFLRNAYRRKY
jgi:hypothetical protein